MTTGQNDILKMRKILKSYWDNFTKPFSQRANKYAVGIAFFVLMFVMFSFYFRWPKAWSIAVVAIIDGYLIMVLVVAVMRSEIHNEFHSDGFLPTKTGALVTFAVCAIVFVISFANIYIKISSSSKINRTGSQTVVNTQFQSVDTSSSTIFISRKQALYFSVVTATTVGYGDYIPISNWAKFYVIFEISSSFLLFFAAFPLLISRVSNFTELPSNGNEHPGTTVEIFIDDLKNDINISDQNGILQIKVNGKEWIKKI